MPVAVLWHRKGRTLELGSSESAPLSIAYWPRGTLISISEARFLTCRTGSEKAQLVKVERNDTLQGFCIELVLNKW